MIIKIRHLKQKVTGLILVILSYIGLYVFNFEEEVGFTVFVIGLLGLWALFGKSRLYDHDVMLTFDVNKFLKG